MKGMQQASAYAWTIESGNYTMSFQYELPPTSTLAQISLATYYEFDNQAHAELGFTECTYVDQNGVTHTDTFPDIDAIDATRMFGRNGLSSASYMLRVSNCYGSAVVNFFFWDSVF